MQKTHRYFLFFLTVTMITSAVFGCSTTPYRNGVLPNGEKAYLGDPAIENTAAYKSFVVSDHTEVDKQKYLFSRLKLASHLQYFHNGVWYNEQEAYRGGTWLMRNRYKKGQNTREFIKNYIERSEDKNQYHLVKYPDGSVQIGSYVLLNELDLLESVFARSKNS